MTRRPIRSLVIPSLVMLLAAAAGRAQVSLSAAVDLALRNNPRVLMAQADVEKARAVLQELHDVYIPALVGGSGLGYSYGFPVGQPSVFNFTAQSLVFNFSQHDYIRAGRQSLTASNFALMDARQAVVEDTVITYLALDRDLQREAALNQQRGFAQRYVNVVQQRLDAGQESPLNLTSARLSAAQIRLSTLRAEDETVIDRAHLARLTGLPAEGLATISSSIPLLDLPSAPANDLTSPADPPAVAAAYAAARAKREIAFGDSRYLYRPQISFAAQYNRFASFNNYENYYRNFQHNNAAFGVQITIPVLDYVHRAKARQSAADAAHAQHEADLASDQFRDGQVRLERNSQELAARAEVAALDQQLAQQQLDIVVTQMNVGSGNLAGPQLSPKDEQSSRIQERQKFLDLVDARFQLQQATVTLLRQKGSLETWLKTAPASSPASKP